MPTFRGQMILLDPGFGRGRLVAGDGKVGFLRRVTSEGWTFMLFDGCLEYRQHKLGEWHRK